MIGLTAVLLMVFFTGDELVLAFLTLKNECGIWGQNYVHCSRKMKY